VSALSIDLACTIKFVAATVAVDMFLVRDYSQGIFRVPGSQIDINQFKDAFEQGDDPLGNVTTRDMNSVAGVLKLYFRELKEPLVVRDMFDLFMSSIGKTIDPIVER
jgi:hypothetical protein